MVRRFPAQIGSWRNPTDGSYSAAGLIELLEKVVTETVRWCERPGVLLSAGVDSALLVALLRKVSPDVPCFTIGTGLDHPDVIAAGRLAEEWGIDWRLYVPSRQAKESARREVRGLYFPGDDGVLLALRFASKWVTDIIATDGIDEQMGGYWWHSHRDEQFPRIEDAFEYFWNELEPKHLKPMFRAADQVGVNLHWVYLQPTVVGYIARIPLSERVRDGIGKAFWREVARLAGVPEWVIQRPKRGFVHALANLDR